jgi:hypothetical protein
VGLNGLNLVVGGIFDGLFGIMRVTGSARG